MPRRAPRQAWHAGAMRVQDTVGVAVLRDAFDRVHDGVTSVLTDLTPEELCWRADAEANPIGWLVWHLTRQQDGQIAHLSGLASPWTTHWESEFATPYPPGASGYGMSPEDVGRFVVADSRLLAGYHDAVHELTCRWLDAVGEVDWGRVVSRQWNPPVTMAVRAVSILEDSQKHLGQAEFLHGILLRRRG